MEAQTTPTSLPPRRVIASYTRYEEAQRAVDYLSDEKFPVERVAIIGEGLQLVEQVTGRLTWGKAALNGVLGGASPACFWDGCWVCSTSSIRWYRLLCWLCGVWLLAASSALS